MYSKGLHMMVAQPRQVRLFSHMLKLQNQHLQSQIAIVNINQVSSSVEYQLDLLLLSNWLLPIVESIRS